MANPLIVYGAEVSPYSVKVRSYLRYKGIPHRFLTRNADTQADFQKHAKLPLIPLVLCPNGEALQDSTPILEHFEALHPEPGIHPPDPVAAFVSVLLEEFGDEWGNKWMFHYRWAREADQLAAAGRIAASMLPRVDEQQHLAMREQIRQRMLSRVGFVGSSEATAPLIEQSFREGIEGLEAHLAERSYLFGARPAFGDFGLWGQVYEAWSDPTCGALIEGRAPRVLDWVQRMLWPRAEGDFEPWSDLEPTLLPFLEEQVGRRFLPWSLANARALAEGDEELSVELPEGPFVQKPQKYHARSLQALREKYAAVPDRQRLDPVLERAGCLPALAG